MDAADAMLGLHGCRTAGSQVVPLVDEARTFTAFYAPLPALRASKSQVRLRLPECLGIGEHVERDERLPLVRPLGWENGKMGIDHGMRKEEITEWDDEHEGENMGVPVRLTCSEMSKL